MKQTIPKDIVGSTLVELGRQNERIVVLSSDVSVSTNIECFHELFPNRFFEMGIAEQSTMSVAGGLATEGMIPVYVALAIFSAGMTFAQMRQVCNANRNVKIIGTHPGVDDGQDGSGHHATEDIAITRALPRMTVMVPGDENELAAAIRTAISMEGPVYIRAARDTVPVLHSADCAFEVGKLEKIRDIGNDFTIIYEGCCQGESLEAFEALTDMGYAGKLISIRTIKPMDEKGLAMLAASSKVVVTVENHSVVGGLYGAVCESLVRSKVPCPVYSVGFHDVFMESAPPRQLKERYGVSATAIIEAVKQELNR